VDLVASPIVALLTTQLLILLLLVVGQVHILEAAVVAQVDFLQEHPRLN
tara:strand:- start:607 stop:753 length:147 start_codon:yes stop_codon:yes gene_type:complete